MISVIVPIFNVEKHIYRCIDSILIQTYTDFELILIDDGSTDRCGEICDEYATLDSRIKVIHQCNLGVSNARNTGLKAAIGRYITFCDGDDELEPECLQHLMNPSDSYDLVITGFQYIDTTEKKQFPAKYEYQMHNEINAEVAFNLLGDFALNYVWGKRFKRSIIERSHIQFDCQLSFAEDTLFAVEYIIQCNSVLVISETDYCYRKYGAVTLSRYTPTMYKQFLEAKKKLITVIEGRFTGIEQSPQWAGRNWPVLRNCLFGTLNCNALSFIEKRKIIREILNDSCFPGTIAQIEQRLPDDGKALKLILRSKSSLLLLLFHEAYQIKKRIICMKRKT